MYLAVQILTKNKQKGERAKVRIGKRKKPTKIYVISYVAANHHTLSQTTDKESNQHGCIPYSQAITFYSDLIEKERFQKASNEELTQLLRMNIWSEETIDAAEVDKSKIINFTFIFKIKRDGRHKCRLVARRAQQKPSTYQKDLMSNTVHHYILMFCRSMALQNNYDIIQLDISSAYFYVTLEEELYIRSPPHLGL